MNLQWVDEMRRDGADVAHEKHENDDDGDDGDWSSSAFIDTRRSHRDTCSAGNDNSYTAAATTTTSMTTTTIITTTTTAYATVISAFTALYDFTSIH